MPLKSDLERKFPALHTYQKREIPQINCLSFQFKKLGRKGKVNPV